MNNTLQLTVRGIDQRTKAALIKNAHQQGISLNRYVLTALQQNAGIEGSESRYLKFKQFLIAHRIDQQEKLAIDDALAWSDKATLAKQNKD